MCFIHPSQQGSCLDCLDTAYHLLSFSGGLKVFYVSGTKYLHYQLPGTTVDTENLAMFLDRWLYMDVTLPCWGHQDAPVWLPDGKSQKPSMVSPRVSHELFLLCSLSFCSVKSWITDSKCLALQKWITELGVWPWGPHNTLILYCFSPGGFSGQIFLGKGRNHPHLHLILCSISCQL